MLGWKWIIWIYMLTGTGWIIDMYGENPLLMKTMVCLKIQEWREIYIRLLLQVRIKQNNDIKYHLLLKFLNKLLSNNKNKDN